MTITERSIDYISGISNAVERSVHEQLMHSYSSIARMVIVLGLAGCATTEPPRAPKLEVDDVELFHRARFKELALRGDDALLAVIARLKPASLSAEEDRLDSKARAAYRHGDGKTAEEAMRALPDASRTKKILAALLAEADLSRRLFHTAAPVKQLMIPLDRRALEAGYVLFSAKVGTKNLRFLWDTGSTENVLNEKTAVALGLSLRAVQYTHYRTDDALVVRFAATGIAAIDVGPWKIENVPAIVTELDIGDTELGAIDGFLSPQLLLPSGCFEVDESASVLRVGFERETCVTMVEKTKKRAALFAWDGEVYVNGRIGASPELGIRLETGSPVTYLRADATRYVPRGAIREAPAEREGEIAHELDKRVEISVANTQTHVSAVDLEPRRRTDGYDDVGTVGADMLLSADGVVVSFATMELGLIENNPIANR
jgi:hypothetical protein